MPTDRCRFLNDHPSCLLRIRDAGDKAREQAKFEADRAMVRDAIAGLAGRRH
jgi:hypothetical protein